MSAEQQEECAFCGTTDPNKQRTKHAMSGLACWCWVCDDCYQEEDEGSQTETYTETEDEYETISVMTTDTPDVSSKPDGGGSRGWNVGNEDTSEDDNYTSDSSDEGLFDVCYTEAQQLLVAETQRQLLQMFIATLCIAPTTQPTTQPTPKTEKRGAYPRSKEQLAQLAKARESNQAKLRTKQEKQQAQDRKKYGTNRETGEINYYQTFYNRSNQKQSIYMKKKVLCECGKVHIALNIGRHRDSELHKARMANPAKYHRWLYAKKQ